MAAGIANLEELGAVVGEAPCLPSGSPDLQHPTGQAGSPSHYQRLEELGAQLEAGLKDAVKLAGVDVTFNRCGSMFCGYFTSEPVWNLADAMKSDRERFKKYFQGMLNAGVYLAPSQFETGFISVAHTAEDIEATVKAAAKVMKTL